MRKKLAQGNKVTGRWEQLMMVVETLQVGRSVSRVGTESEESSPRQNTQLGPIYRS